jgi:hypothetical protein
MLSAVSNDLDQLSSSSPPKPSDTCDLAFPFGHVCLTGLKLPSRINMDDPSRVDPRCPPTPEELRNFAA